MATQQNPGSPSSETWFVIIFWGAIIAIAAFFYFKEDRAEVLLDVSAQQESVSGVVTFESAPLRGGVVHVVLSEAGNQRYVAGATLAVSADGRFTSQDQPALGISEKEKPLRLTATFRGTLIEKGKDDPKGKPVSGEAVLYLNSPPPLGARFLWCVAIAGALLLAFQLVLFTGDLGPRKARWLFVLMYFFTFFSLAVPIIASLVVAQNHYLLESMADSPLGLVKAKTKVLSDQQWLVNIGGTVDWAKPVAAPGATGAADKSAEAEEAKKKAVAEAQAAGKQLRQPGIGSETRVRFVEGGVAVPFYVLLLAMFGAGINMTLKVPVIQRSYEDVLPETPGYSLLNPILATVRMFRRQPEESESAAGVVSGPTAGDIRRELIENYMYLLSAPLLAIAMYYLLQVLANEVAQSVLVIMSFATGLVSKAVIRGIIEFAESKLGQRPRRDDSAPAEVAARTAEAEKKQEEAAAAEKELGEAKAKETAAETAAKTAGEAAQRALEKQSAVEAAVRAGKATQDELDGVREEAEKAKQEASAKKAEAEEAARAATQIEQKTEAKQAEARAASNAARQAEAREAGKKQAEVRTAAKATEKAAKVTTEKQAEAEAALKALQPPAERREGTPPEPGAPTTATKKD